MSSSVSSPLRRTLARVAALAATGVVVAVLGALPAWAHIRVSSPDAAAGGYSLLTFRVPTEKDTASTTTVQVTMPANQPLASVSVQPHPGWTASVHKTTLPQPLQTDDGPVTQVVSDVVWTAQTPQSAIAPGQFDQFSLLAGPLPSVASLSFPASQTYSDGSVVAWNQQSAPGAPEPQHPAPTLTVKPASDHPDTATAYSSDSSSTSAPLVLSIVALVVAAIALAGLAVALVRGRGAPRS